MKNSFLFLLITLVLFSCVEDDEVEAICLEGPCGMVDETAINLTLQLYNRGTTFPATTGAVVYYDGGELFTEFDTAFYKEFSCWQTIPSNSIYSVRLLSPDSLEAISITKNFSSNELRLIILRDSSESISAEIIDYDGECRDTPLG